uniref:Putative secreted protein n=1 Tax=Anopheles marajoara TaxID=58244 RepID=A0A2M4C8S0_9DIPT
MFAHRHVLPQRIMLRTVAECLEGIVLVDGNAMPGNPHRTTCRGCLTGHYLHGGRLTGPIVTEQTEHLACVHTERKTAHRNLLLWWFIVRTAATVAAQRFL